MAKTERKHAEKSQKKYTLITIIITTLGARDFSSAVSGFCQVFFSRLRPSADTENFRRRREKPLVPKVTDTHGKRKRFPFLHGAGRQQISEGRRHKRVNTNAWRKPEITSDKVSGNHTVLHKRHRSGKKMNKRCHNKWKINQKTTNVSLTTRK